MADQVLTDEHTAERRPHEEGGQHGAHPTDFTYIKIALLLSALTAIEVAVSYIKGLELAGNPILLILAACKFSIVVLFFMHLRFDSRVFRYVFVGGLLLAMAVYVSVLRMFHVLF